MQIMVHGKKCVIVGGRCYAVRKELDTAERIHSRTQIRGTWDRQMTKPAVKLRNSRSIRG